MRAMIAIARICKKAGLLGLFVWLAVAGISASMSPALAQPSLLEQLQKGDPSLPPPPRKSGLPPLRLQIESATPIIDERTKEPVITIRLTDRSGRMFGELTKNNVGRRTEVRIDGQVVMSPIIREPILGGSLQVSGGFTLKDAQELAERLNSGGARIEVEVVD
jgi:preprotein translocase subunit SecD